MPSNDRLHLSSIYDARASRYETEMEPFSHFLPIVRRFLAENVRPHMRVLDVGCATGYLTADLPPSVDVVGLDISEAMLAEARKQRPAGVFRIHDFHQPVPADLGTFDVILASSCFDFCEDVNAVIGNLARVLRPGGMLFFSIDERRESLTLQREASLNLKGDGIDLHLFFYTPEQVRAALSAAGLQVRSCESGAGWYSRHLKETIQYGYWTVERPAEQVAA
jgi:SAM-dependent methyltransferase